MTKIKALRDLHITKEEGLTKANIDKVIDVLLETPSNEFGKNGELNDGLSKLELLDLYYKVRTFFKENESTTRIWLEVDEWELIRD